MTLQLPYISSAHGAEEADPCYNHRQKQPQTEAIRDRIIHRQKKSQTKESTGGFRDDSRLSETEKDLACG